MHILCKCKYMYVGNNRFDVKIKIPHTKYIIWPLFQHPIHVFSTVINILYINIEIKMTILLKFRQIISTYVQYIRIQYVQYIYSNWIKCLNFPNYWGLCEFNYSPDIKSVLWCKLFCYALITTVCNKKKYDTFIQKNTYKRQ